MNFAEVDRRYAELWQMYQTGTLSAEQFDQQLHAMMIQDDQGRWWAKARESGEWHYFDQTTGAWIRATPVAAPPTLPATPATPAAPATPQTVAWAPARTTGSTAGAGSAALQSPVPAQSYANPAVLASESPELGSGLKVIFYILSFVFGLIGIILFFVYRNKPAAADRAAARIFLLLGVLSMLLSCLCTVSYAVLIGGTLMQ